MRYRSVLTFLVIGLLAVTTLYGYADSRAVRQDYERYRDGVFARSYEAVLSDLGTYLSKGDGSLSSRIVAGLAALPLSDKEVETVRRLGEDMTAGLYDENAKERAMQYSETLFRYLAGNRSASYRGGWRASGLGLPDYPEESREAVARPEVDEGLSLREEVVRRLLGRKKTVSYERERNGVPLYGYRTASSYVELTEEGRPLRYLRALPEGAPYPGEGAKETAASFLMEYQWEAAVLSEGEIRENTVLFSVICAGEEGILGVGSDGVFLFRMGEG